MKIFGLSLLSYTKIQLSHQNFNFFSEQLLTSNTYLGVNIKVINWLKNLPKQKMFDNKCSSFSREILLHVFYHFINNVKMMRRCWTFDNRHDTWHI